MHLEQVDTASLGKGDTVLIRTKNSEYKLRTIGTNSEGTLFEAVSTNNSFRGPTKCNVVGTVSPEGIFDGIIRVGGALHLIYDEERLTITSYVKSVVLIRSVKPTND